MGKLAGFIKTSKTFVDFKNQAAHTFKLLDVEIVPNKFGEGDTVKYLVEEDGVNRTFTSQKLALAEAMDDMIGKTVRVTRTGSGNKVDYKVEEIPTK